MKPELKDLLDSNIPSSVVSKRNQGGKELSYLETWYVIDRLNQVFGTDNWNWNVVKMDPVPGDKISFICQGLLVVDFGNNKYSQKAGIGFGSDKSNFNAGEMASKEAESDALKRAAMKFGRSLGLALYDKSGEYVDEEQTKTSVKPQEKPKAVVQETTRELVKEKASGVKPANVGSRGDGGAAVPDINTPVRTGQNVDTRIQRQSIKSYFAVLKAKNIVTAEAFKTKYLSNKLVDHLTDEEVLATLNKVKTDFKNELSL